MMEVRGKERCEKGKLSPTDRQLQGGGDRERDRRREGDRGGKGCKRVIVGVDDHCFKKSDVFRS